MPVLFPLRSNAHALITGPSIATVRRRIKVAALLPDQARRRLRECEAPSIRTRTTTRCEAHPSDELVVPPGDQVVHLTRLLHREPFQMVTAIQQPGHCLWRVRKPLSPQAPDE